MYWSDTSYADFKTLFYFHNFYKIFRSKLDGVITTCGISSALSVVIKYSYEAGGSGALEPQPEAFKAQP